MISSSTRRRSGNQHKSANTVKREDDHEGRNGRKGKHEEEKKERREEGKKGKKKHTLGAKKNCSVPCSKSN